MLEMGNGEPKAQLVKLGVRNSLIHRVARCNKFSTNFRIIIICSSKSPRSRFMHLKRQWFCSVSPPSNLKSKCMRKDRPVALIVSMEDNKKFTIRGYHSPKTDNKLKHSGKQSFDNIMKVHPIGDQLFREMKQPRKS